MVLKSVEIEKLSDEEIEELIIKLERNPVDINRADFDELYSVPFLDFTLCENILSFRRDQGGFSGWKDFYRFSSLDQEFGALVKKCLTFSKPLKQQSSLMLSGRFRDELPARSEIADSLWLGSSPYYQQQVHFQQLNGEYTLSSSFTTKKETGEIAAGNSFKYNFEYSNQHCRLIGGNFSHRPLSSFARLSGSFSGVSSPVPQLKFEQPYKAASGSSLTDLQGGAVVWKMSQQLQAAVSYGEIYLPAENDSNGTVNDISYSYLLRTAADFQTGGTIVYRIGGADAQYLLNNTLLHSSLLWQQLSKPVEQSLQLPGSVLLQSRWKQRWSDSLYTDLKIVAMPECRPSLEVKSLWKQERTSCTIGYTLLQERNYLLPVTPLLAAGILNEHLISAEIGVRDGNQQAALTGEIGLRKFALEPEQIYRVSSVSVNAGHQAGLFNYKLQLKNRTGFVCYSTGIKKENESSYQLKIGWESDSLALQTILGFKNSNLDNRPYGYIFGQSVRWQPGRNWEIRCGGNLFYSQSGVTITQTRVDIGSMVNTRYYSGEGHDFYLRAIWHYQQVKAAAGVISSYNIYHVDEHYRTIFQLELNVNL